MTRRSVPGDSLLYQLDPRTKILLQGGIVVAAYALPARAAVIGLAVLAPVLGRLGNQRVGGILWQLRYLSVLLGFAAGISGIQLGHPWFDPAAASRSAMAGGRVLLLVVTCLTIARTTNPRRLEAAIRWFVPGRSGRIGALGIGLVFRFLPQFQAEIRRTKQAMDLRGGAQSPLHERAKTLGIVVFDRLLGHADRTADALKVRCLAWDATKPAIAFGRTDGIVLLVTGSAVVMSLTWTIG